MLPSFPALQDDELLYGAVARYHREAGWTGWSATLDTLFGRRHVVASHELPGHLGALAEQLRPGDRQALDALVDGATLLPYLTAPVDSHRRNEARRSVVSGGGSSHLSLGLATTTVPRLRRLRFCPVCRDSDLAAEGFFWWRRRHQLPGSLVCVRHGVPLYESTHDLACLGRHVFLAADARSCPDSAAAMIADDTAQTMERLLALATADAAVLDTGSLPGDGIDIRTRLEAAGLFRSRRRVDQAALLERITAFYAPAARWLPGVLAASALSAWVPSLTRDGRGARHPVFHVALSVFLDAQEPRPASPTSPFGLGPWPCRNPLAPHADAQPKVTLTTCRSKGLVTGRFTCSCGYVYGRAIDADGMLGPPRYIAFGPTLEPQLRALVVAGASLRATARALEVDPSTVVLEARRLGVEVPWGNSRKQATRRRGRAPRSISRLSSPRRVHRSRCDWTTVDTEAASRFRRARDVLLDASPPERVTVTALERQAMLRPGWLRTRRPRLPLTSALVDAAVETTRTFKARRAASVIASLSEPVPGWRIMRQAGLTGVDLPMIETLMAASFPHATLTT